MRFQKHDLAGTHYNWTEDEKLLFTGEPSRRSFDMFNGNQVLFLINLCESLSEHFTIAELKKVEHGIQHDLPLTAKSEISVFNWIRETFFSTK